jgi:AraC-like DNA-binding protein
MADRIRGLLRKQPDLCNLDALAIAGELGVSLRALRRSLARDGLTMTLLADEARVDAARVELSRPGVTIKDTALRLGYSEISAFHRAFKRWTGKTPAEYVRESRLRLPGQLPRASQADGMHWAQR